MSRERGRFVVILGFERIEAATLVVSGAEPTQTSRQLFVDFPLSLGAKVQEMLVVEVVDELIEPVHLFEHTLGMAVAQQSQVLAVLDVGCTGGLIAAEPQPQHRSNLKQRPACLPRSPSDWIRSVSSFRKKASASEAAEMSSASPSARRSAQRFAKRGSHLRACRCHRSLRPPAGDLGEGHENVLEFSRGMCSSGKGGATLADSSTSRASRSVPIGMAPASGQRGCAVPAGTETHPHLRVVEPGKEVQ